MFIVSEKQEIQASYLKIAYFSLSVLSESLWFLQNKGKSLQKHWESPMLWFQGTYIKT